MKNFMPDVFELIKMLFWAGVEVKREAGGGGTGSIHDGHGRGSERASYCKPLKIHETEILHPKKT